MKNNLFFRIIGALASSLIIISIFMPFTNLEVTNLWDMYSSPKLIYLPIMILVFGGISLICFLSNIKTEFAYCSSGAVIFYVVTQLMQSVYNKSISDLGLGFYFLAIGGVLIGFMAFLSNLKKKEKNVEPIKQQISVNVESNDQTLSAINQNKEVSDHTIPPIQSQFNNIPAIPGQTLQGGNELNNSVGAVQNNNEVIKETVSPVNVLEAMPSFNSVPNMSEPVREVAGQSINQVIAPKQVSSFNNPINMSQPNLNEPIKEIVNQQAKVEIPTNTIPQSMENNLNNAISNPTQIAYPGPNSSMDQQLSNSNVVPFNNQESFNSNPVVNQFSSSQSQSINNQNANQNMQGLDIFGNFN